MRITAPVCAPMDFKMAMSRRFSITIMISALMMLSAATRMMSAKAMKMPSFSCACIRTVPQFLVVQGLSGGVNPAEPLQLFGRRPPAHVDVGLIIQYPFRNIRHVREQVREVLRNVCREAVRGDCEFPRDVLADGKDPLLTVKDFVCAVFVVYPVDDVERALIEDRLNDGVPLLRVVDAVSLIRRSDVQLSVISEHGVRCGSVVGVPHVSFHEVTNRKPLPCILHGYRACLHEVGYPLNCHCHIKTPFLITEVVCLLYRMKISDKNAGIHLFVSSIFEQQNASCIQIIVFR